MSDRLLDCDEGRRLGCQTYCCRLIVRLADQERGSFEDAVSLLAKDLGNGCCEHLDRESDRCLIWNERPEVCRQYDCNLDPLLQIVLRDGFTSVLDLVTSEPVPPEAPQRRIPYVRDAADDD